MNEDNLDKLFQEKLTDFQELPDDRVWRSIEASLDKKHGSRWVIPLWWKLGGAAAVLAIFFFAIDPFSITNAVDPVITEVENKGSEKEVDNRTNDVLNNTIKNNTSVTNTQGVTKKGSILEVVTKADNRESSKAEAMDASLAKETDDNDKFLNYEEVKAINVAAKGANKENDHMVGESPTLGKIQDSLKTPNTFQFSDDRQLVEGDILHKPGQEQLPTTLEEAVETMDPKKKSILDDIENSEETIKVAETQGGKWSAGPTVAPIYFNGFGEGSPINSILASNSKTGNVTLSYGLTVSYEVSKKISIRSGIHKVDYGYTTNDVSFTSSFNTASNAQLKNINYTNTAQSIVLRDTRNQLGAPLNGSQIALDFTGKNPTRMGTMGQQIGYLEVPMEINFAIVDRKFGVNLIGGLSSLFLMDNVVVLQSSGQTTELGEANNINSVNFSTNIGLGLNYRFSNNLKLNVEPVFKYQLNTFDGTSGSFNPYSLGVYSGFSFKF